MPVDDLWYLRKRGPNNERVKSKRYGQGKRSRVRYQDASGTPRTRFFERQVDAQEWDARQRAGLVDLPTVARPAPTVTFREYGERWRLAREVSWALETRKRVESNLRIHLYPAFGDLSPDGITPTLLLEWLSRRLAEGAPKSSLKLYFELLDTVLAAAVVDRVAAANPCDGVKLGQVLRGVSRAPKWVPTEGEVLALFDAVPDRYRGVLWLGAGQGCRISEALGMEAGPRCVDSAHAEVHVVQQLRYSPKEHGGFYLSPPKSGSAGTVDLDPVVDQALTEHVRKSPARRGGDGGYHLG